ncbi:hypothetical protein [Vibrio aestuarianus]|uniref:ParE family toxin-like protein n=1 Tax=Vibrio aestuarianus TaxID=28171 RepID=UPI003BB17333
MQKFHNIEFKKGVPYHVVRKASEVLLSSQTGRQSSRKITTRFGIKYVINVGNRYRLLSNNKQVWKLLSHESYNRYS